MSFEDDQHEMYIAYDSKMQAAALSRGDSEVSIMELRATVDLHRMYAARRQDVINPGQMGEIVPGIGAGPGEVDNNLQAALATGGIPSATPQGATPQAAAAPPAGY